MSSQIESNDTTINRGKSFSRRAAFTPVSLAAIIAIFLTVSPVLNTGSDSFGSLVVSQHIIRSGNIQLDDYRDYFVRPDGTLHNSITEWRGHLYNYFPVGAPLVSLPVVAALNLAGLDVRQINSPLQKLIGGLIAGGIFLVCYAMARLWYSLPVSLALSAGLIFGTIIAPTVGTALWSINFEILFMSFCVLYMLKISLGQPRPFSPWLLGLFLFLGYISRPTMVPFIVVSLLYLFAKERNSALRAGGIAALLLAGFMVWSKGLYGQFLPPYYAISRLDLSVLPSALTGTLLSPSRNIFIWSPVMLLLPVLLIAHFRKLSAVEVALFAAGLISLLPIITFPHWWVGHSFGPRTTATPVFLLSIGMAVHCATSCRQRPNWSRAFSLLLVAGIPLSISGLYNSATAYWNVFPDIGKYPTRIIYDWRYPQFLATQKSLAEKYLVQSRELGLQQLSMLPVRATTILAGAEASRQFTVNVAPYSPSVWLTVFFVDLASAPIGMRLNGIPIATLAAAKFGTTTIEVPSDLLRIGKPNEISFASRRRGKALPLLAVFICILESS